MSVRKICCICADNVGVSFGSVVAFKCPDIEVHVLDQNEERLKKWNSVELSVCGKEFADIVRKCRDENLFLTSKPQQAITNADIIFICAISEMKSLGLGKGKTVDLKPVEEAARLIAKWAKPSQIVVEKTTIPIRAADTVAAVLKANKETKEDGEKSFIVLSNPEFLAEETLLNDLLLPERVLIGGPKTTAKAAIETVANLYANWVPKNKIITSDTWSTELAKIAVNAFLAQRIASIISLSEICEATNADVSEVALAIGMDTRIRPSDLTASMGFGGPTLPKDIRNMVYLSESLNLPQVATYWQKVLDFNEHQKKRFTKKIVEAFFNTLTDKSIAILGFAFKKNTKDTTESPALYVCKTLLEEGAKLKIFDPIVSSIQIMKDLKENCDMEEEKIEKMVTVADGPYEAAEGTHGIVICTDWDQFATIDYFKVYNDMVKPAYIFDGWKMLPHNELLEIGFNVRTIGKNLDSNFSPPAEG